MGENMHGRQSGFEGCSFSVPMVMPLPLGLTEDGIRGRAPPPGHV